MESEVLLIVLFTISMIVIFLEWYYDYPFGKYDGIVFMYVPPFIKRVRIFNKWIGFNSNWKFIFFKELK